MLFGVRGLSEGQQDHQSYYICSMCLVLGSVLGLYINLFLLYYHLVP